MDTLKAAKDLYDQGFAIHWLKEKSKAPVGSGWTTGPRKKWAQLEATYRPGYNVGVRLGTPSKLKSGYLMVIDVDVKSDKPHHREEALTAARRVLEHGGTSNIDVPIVRSGYGNGSRHYYVVTEQPFKTYNAASSPEKIKARIPSKKPSKKEIEQLTPAELKAGIRLVDAWQVSLYSDGRQVVLPPSIHPDTDRPYIWRRPIAELGQVPLLKRLPKQQENGDAVKAEKGTESALAGGTCETKSSGSVFSFTPAVVDIEWLPISDEVRSGILHGTGVSDRSGYLMRAGTALLSAGLSHDEVLSVLTDKKTYLGACGYEHAQTKDRHRAAHWVWHYTLARLAKERSPSIFGEVPACDDEKATPEEREAIAREIASERSWKQDLDLTDKGKVRVTLKNIHLILSNAVPETPHLFMNDCFAHRLQFGVAPPWADASRSDSAKAGDYVRDIDMVQAKQWFSENYGIEPTTQAIYEAASLLGNDHRTHPVRDWLESLWWDEKPRIHSWLKDYCHAQADEPYLSEVSRTFLLAMVARVFEPGCQMDYILVLEGGQGRRKSTIARTIAGDRWFMDNLPDLKDKDSMLNLRGKWLVELAELASIKHTDFNAVKAYISRRSDSVRAPYERLAEDTPRQSVFIGTVNEGQYFKDPTGNRRYWPVKVGECNVEALQKVREQLFAEAMHIYRTERPALMLSADAEAIAKENQDHRRVDDEESEMREALVAFVKSEQSKEFPFDRFKTRDLMMGPNAPWGPWGQIGKGYIMNIAAHVLTGFGFSRHKVEGQRYWRKETGSPLLP